MASYNHRDGVKQPKLKKLILVAGLLLAFIGVFMWQAVERWYDSQLVPVADEVSFITFEVVEGASTSEIASELENQGLVRSAMAFLWYVNRETPDSQILSGVYSLSPSLSIPEIVAILTQGEVATELVTIPPGARLDQVATALTQAGFEAQAVERALNQRYTHPLLATKPETASLEGYIYPETLQITAESTPESVIQRSFDVFYERLTPTLRDGLADQGLTLHEAIILASIIQKEAYDDDDQRTIAQVFLSRLERDMVLGADATFRYAAAISGAAATPGLDSPYNTRRYAGLPPGPIANFTMSALEAVANPTDTDYLYFVHGDDCIDDDPATDCTTHFARTEAEHEANVRRYCLENCRL